MKRDYLSLESESTTRVFSILTPGAPKAPGTRAMSLRFGRQSCCFPGRDRREEAPRAATTPHLPPSAHRLPDTLGGASPRPRPPRSRHGPPRNDHARTNHEPDNDHASPHTPTTPPSSAAKCADRPVVFPRMFFRASRKVAGSRCENRRNSPSICIAGRVLRWQVRARSMDRGVGNLAAPRHSAGSWTMSPAWIVEFAVGGGTRMAEVSVTGLHGQRVADASIMPMPVSGNISAATIMIGENGCCVDPARPLLTSGSHRRLRRRRDAERSERTHGRQEVRRCTVTWPAPEGAKGQRIQTRDDRSIPGPIRWITPHVLRGRRT